MFNLSQDNPTKTKIEYRYENNKGEVKLQARLKNSSGSTGPWFDSVKVDGDKRELFAQPSWQNNRNIVNFR